MRRIAILLAAVVLLQVAAVAEARRTVVVRKGPHRTTVVVHRGFPLRRPMRQVIIHPLRHPLLVAAPRLFLAPVVWTSVVVVEPQKELLVWQDTELLRKDEEWTEFSLSVNERGTALYMRIAGKAQIDFAEVVFENGDAQVVDFDNKSCESGLFRLLDFKDGRKVSHVRMVAQAKSGEARVTVLMEK